METMEEILTSKEVAQWIRISESTLCRWRQRGMGPQVTWMTPTCPDIGARTSSSGSRGRRSATPSAPRRESDVIEKTPGGRFRARLKSGRQFVASRTFDTKREASEWLARERAALAGGVDPRTGRRPVRVLLEEWLTTREFTVAAKTYRTDRALQRLVPISMQAMQVAAVSEREVARSFESLIQQRSSRLRAASRCVLDRRESSRVRGRPEQLAGVRYLRPGDNRCGRALDRLRSGSRSPALASAGACPARDVYRLSRALSEALPWRAPGRGHAG